MNSRPVGEEQHRGPRLNSIPRVSFIQRFPVLLAKPAILGLEILLFVMLWLIANVFPHRLDVHRADTELAVTALPREIGIPCVLVLDPNR